MGGIAGADYMCDTGDTGEVDDEGKALAPGIDSFGPFDLWCALFLWPAWGGLRAR